MAPYVEWFTRRLLGFPSNGPTWKFDEQVSAIDTLGFFHFPLLPHEQARIDPALIPSALNDESVPHSACCIDICRTFGRFKATCFCPRRSAFTQLEQCILVRLSIRQDMSYGLPLVDTCSLLSFAALLGSWGENLVCLFHSVS